MTLKPDILQRNFQFAEKCVRNHTWAKEVKENFERTLGRLKSRLSDPLVNISVVGEFSVGKSSFINAILGVNLLATDDLPDTTLVPAVMSYSPAYTFKVVRESGAETARAMTIEEIRSELAKFTVPEPLVDYFGSEREYMEALKRAREQAALISGDIVRFEIGVPSEFLRHGFRLIDTPGLSSGNERCGAIAKKEMLESDASIIVAHATRGVLTESSREIFTDFLGEKLKHCMVVFTRYDLTTPARRDKLRRHLEASTRSYFNLTDEQMPVFMAVPPVIEAEREGRRFGPEHDEMLKLTRESLDSIAAIARNRRESLLAESLIKLFKQLFDSLVENLNSIRKVVDERLEELERSKSAPLVPFVEREKEFGLSSLEEGSRIRLRLTVQIDDILRETRRECDSKVFLRTTTVSELTEYLKNGLTAQLTEAAERIKYPLREALDRFSILVKGRLDAFENNLKAEFKRLNLLPVKFEVDASKISVPAVTIDGISSLGDISAGQERNDRNGITGAVIGGIIGSIVTLGFGTAVGAFLGGLFFSGDGKNGIKGAREKVKPQYEQQIQKALDLIRDKNLAAYSAGVRDMITGFRDHLQNYIFRYEAVVNERIKKEMTEIEGYRRYRHSLEEELREIEAHSGELNSMLFSMSTYSIKD